MPTNNAHQSSGVLSAGADQLVYTGKGSVASVTIVTDLTNDVLVEVKDNATVIWKGRCPGTEDTKHCRIPNIRFGTSLKVSVTGTGGEAVVAYRGD